MSTNLMCPVCSSGKTNLLKFMPRYPAIVFPVDPETDVDQKDLEIHKCDHCTHIFQANIDHDFNALLYTKYYKYYPYSNAEFFLEHYRTPFERIFETFICSRKQGKLLEIGVSDPKQLDFFKDKNFTSTGITPEAIDHSGIISSFYEDYSFEKKFDVIVSRFNLEHIVDVNFFMSKVKKDLNEKGIFIAQVPNITAYTQENILNFYVHEHIHYFTKQSLMTLFQTHGLSVEAIYDYSSPSLLIVGIKNGTGKNKTIEHYNKDTEHVKKSVRTLVHACMKNKKKVIFYGAGLSLNELLREGFGNVHTSKENIVIIDDNPVVEGKNMPTSGIPIQPYNTNLIAPGDIIILTLNAVYHERVIDKIKKSGLKNEIYCINKSGMEKAAG